MYVCFAVSEGVNGLKYTSNHFLDKAVNNKTRSKLRFWLIRRRGRVVECGGLENRYARKGIEGSNPSASVIFKK